MSSDKSAADDSGRTGYVYLLFDGELMIDAPIEDTWRHVMNYPSWQNYSIVQHVSGEPGGEGEEVLLKKEEGTEERPPYRARTIKIDAQHRIIWKTYPEHAHESGFGIVEFKVDKAEGKTRFSYNTLYEFVVPYQHENELELFRRKTSAEIELVFSTIFSKLKTLAESERAKTVNNGQ